MVDANTHQRNKKQCARQKRGISCVSESRESSFPRDELYFRVALVAPSLDTGEAIGNVRPPIRLDVDKVQVCYIDSGLKPSW